MLLRGVVLRELNQLGANKLASIQIMYNRSNKQFVSSPCLFDIETNFCLWAVANSMGSCSPTGK